MNNELTPMGAIDEGDRKRAKSQLFTWGLWLIVAGLTLSALGLMVGMSEIKYDITRDDEVVTRAAIALGVGIWGQLIGLLMVLTGCVVSAIRDAST